MNLQEKAIKEFELEIVELKNHQKELLKKQMSPKIKNDLRSIEKNIGWHRNAIMWIPRLTNKAITSLLLDELEIVVNEDRKLV